MRYTVVLEQEEDGGNVASVPTLPGCVSQGDNRAQALSHIREAIQLYIEDCRDAGDPVPPEAGKEFVEIEAAWRNRRAWPSFRPISQDEKSKPRSNVPASYSAARLAVT